MRDKAVGSDDGGSGDGGAGGMDTLSTAPQVLDSMPAPGAPTPPRPPSPMPYPSAPSANATTADSASAATAAPSHEADGGRRQRRGFMSWLRRGPGATAEAKEDGDDASNTPAQPPPAEPAPAQECTFGGDADAASLSSTSKLESVPPGALAPRVSPPPLPPVPRPLLPATQPPLCAARSTTGAAVTTTLRQAPRLVAEEDGPANDLPPFGFHPVSSGDLPGIVGQGAENLEITDAAGDAATGAATSAASCDDSEAVGAAGGTAEPEVMVAAEGVVAAAEQDDAAAQRARPCSVPVYPQSAPLPTFASPESPMHDSGIAGPQPRPSQSALQSLTLARGAGASASVAPPPDLLQQLLTQVLRGLLYGLSRPLYLALGAAVYLVFGLVVLVLWLGLLVWPAKLAFHGYWVLAGWWQGFEVYRHYASGAAVADSGDDDMNNDDAGGGGGGGNDRPSRDNSVGRERRSGTWPSRRLANHSVFTPAAILEALQAAGVPEEQAAELTQLNPRKKAPPLRQRKASTESSESW